MKVKGLDHKTYVWNLSGFQPPADDLVPRSEPHLRVRKFLKELYPLDKILEEVPLPGSGNLRADFVILSRRMVIEVHGEQHYKFIPHFHGTELEFLKSKERDAVKQVWCEINNLRAITLSYNESEAQWKKIILK